MPEFNWRRVKEGYVILDQESMDKVNAAIAAGSEALVDGNEVDEENPVTDEAGSAAGDGEAVEDEERDSELEDREPANKKRKTWQA